MLRGEYTRKSRISQVWALPSLRLTTAEISALHSGGWPAGTRPAGTDVPPRAILSKNSPYSVSCMQKKCFVCGEGPAVPAKPVEEPEDCERCGGKGSVRESEEDEEGTEDE